MALAKRPLRQGQSSAPVATGPGVGKPGVTEGRYLPSGDESGTAPEDRRFRPDVEGLRAVAVLLVVLFHVFVTAKSGAVSGGYIGVNVFFVISGFVITGVLLRECKATGKIGLMAFYARRARRIIPAMAVVIVVSVLVERFLVSSATRDLVTNDAKWSSIFLANVHLSRAYPNFLVHRPDTPLQNYWSLAVEEQFYLVYPALVIAISVGLKLWSLRAKLIGLLVATIIVSLIWFLTSTRFEALAYSPFSLAWEFAVGGVLAVGTLQLKKLSPMVAAALSWVGLVGVVAAGFMFTLTSPNPGLVAGLPVAATALVIAGGTAAPRWGAEALLSLAAFRWLGRWSYSYYLWHWPILVFAAQYWGHPTVLRNITLAIVALAIAALSYFYIENPIRHSRVLQRSHAASLLFGALLVATCFALAAAVS